MDPIAISAATLAAKWAAESIVKEAAKSGLTALKPIYDWVWARFSTDASAGAALQKLDDEPADVANTADLAELISKRLAAEPALRPELEKLIDGASVDPKAASFTVQVSENAKVGKIVTIGTVNGNVTF